jgi:hypothetical protein
VFSGLPLNFQDISKLPLNFQDISGIGAPGVSYFILQPGILYPFRSRITCVLEIERIQYGLCAKFSANSKCVFCRIRNERFQGNPGNRLAFFTVCAPSLPAYSTFSYLSHARIPCLSIQFPFIPVSPDIFLACLVNPLSNMFLLPAFPACLFIPISLPF